MPFLFHVLDLRARSMLSVNGFSETAALTPSTANGVAYIVINGLTLVIGALGNLLVLTVVFANFHTSTISDLLVANLASIDVLTALVLIPGGIYRHVCAKMGYCHVSETAVVVHRILVQFAVTAAISSLLTIAVDRFIAIVLPFRHRTWPTKKCAIIGVLFTWMSGVFVTGIFNGLGQVYIQNSYCICLLLISSFLYLYIFSIALKQETKIAAVQALYRPRPSVFLWERKSTKTMVIVLGVYALCWVPSVVFYSVTAKDYWRFPNIQSWVNTMYYLNAASDPFIYCLRSKRFRKAVEKLFKSWRVNNAQFPISNTPGIQRP